MNIKEDDRSIQRMRAEITDRLTRRNRKYRFWLTAMRYSGVFLRSRDRGKMFEADYLWMREIDDIADGDLIVPEGYASPVEYVDKKLNFLLRQNEPTDDVERLMGLCSHLSEKTGLNLFQARREILESMLFDAKRLGTSKIYPEDELQKYFYKCDIAGTAAGTLALYGENPNMWPAVYDTGCAVRIYYNLRDFRHDIEAGLVNVSEEDCNRFGISLDDLHDANSPPIRAWFQTQAKIGLSLLETGARSLRNAGFGPIGVGFVHLYHEKPTKKFLQSIVTDA